MSTLSEELQSIRKYLKWLSEFDVANETHPGGLRLAKSDAIAEEVLILEEMKRVYSEIVERLYQEATKRAESRHIDPRSLLDECRSGFVYGMEAALGKMIKEEVEYYLQFIRSESNIGFAFVCGVMAVLEAIKGRGYKASWQGEGEDSALANIKRKYDRLKALKGTEPGALSFEDRPTTAADLAVYAVKFTTWFNEFDQEGFKAWIKEVKYIASTQEEKRV